MKYANKLECNRGESKQESGFFKLLGILQISGEQYYLPLPTQKHSLLNPPAGGRDVMMPRQFKESTWPTRCTAFVENLTSRFSSWFNVTRVKNGFTEGKIVYISALAAVYHDFNSFNSVFSCVGIEEHQAPDIERYHCPECTTMHGPLTREFPLLKSMLLFCAIRAYF